MNYVKDSTKGTAVPDPESYKKDRMIQAWLQSRHLATLLRWLEKDGMFIRFQSDIVRITLEQVVYHLIEHGEVEMVDLQEDADKILDTRFGERKTDGRGKRNIEHNLALDCRRMEIFGGRKEINTPAKRSMPDIDELVAEAVKIDTKTQKEQEDNMFEEAVGKIEFDEHGVAVLNGRKPHSIVGEEEMKEFTSEQVERDRLHKEEKEQLKIKNQIVRLQEKLKLSEDDDTPRQRSYEEIEADRREKDEKLDREFKEGMDVLPKATFNNNT